VRVLSSGDVDDFVQGIVAYGGGGGGSLQIGQAWAKQINALGQPKLVDLDEVEDDKGAVCILLMADPSIATSLPGPLATQTFEAIAAHLRHLHLTYAVAIEIGCACGPVPLYLSAALASHGIVAIDADATGRTAPDGTCCQFASQPISPTLLLSPEGFQCILSGKIQAGSLEGVLASALAPPFSAEAGIAVWPMTGKLLKSLAVPGSISRAIQVGKLINANSSAEQIAACMNGTVLFQGTLLTSTALVSGGKPGSVVLENAGVQLTLFNDFENLIAWRSDQAAPVAMAPDILSLIDVSTGKPFTTVSIDLPPVGTMVAVIAAPANPAIVNNPAVMAAFQNAVATGASYAGPVLSPFRK